MVPSGLPAHSLTPATSFPKNLPFRYLWLESESSAKGQSEAGLALKQDMCPVHGQCLTDWGCVADVRVASRWPNAGLQLSGHLRRKDTRPAFEARTMYWGLGPRKSGSGRGSCGGGGGGRVCGRKSSDGWLSGPRPSRTAVWQDIWLK